MNFGIEQYIVVLLGVAIHWLWDLRNGWWMRENREPFSFKKWWSHNSLPFITNIVASWTLIFILKDFMDFDEIPKKWENAICVGIGYQGNEWLKGILKKTSQRIMGGDEQSNNEL